MALPAATHLPERVVGDPSYVEHLLGRSIVASGGQGCGQLALDRDQRQVPAQCVVQIAGEAQPFLGDGQLSGDCSGAVDLPAEPECPDRHAAGERDDADQVDIEGTRLQPTGQAGESRTDQHDTEQQGRPKEWRKGQRQKATHEQEHGLRDVRAREPCEAREGQGTGRHAGSGQTNGDGKQTSIGARAAEVGADTGPEQGDPSRGVRQRHQQEGHGSQDPDLVLAEDDQ
jgi:hypothetical protein